MTFKRQPRYWVRAYSSNAFVYLNGKGEQTSPPKKFGDVWTNGEPGTWTLDRAMDECHKANISGLGPAFRFDPVGDSYN